MRLLLLTLCFLVVIWKCHSFHRLRKCCPHGFSVDGSDPTYPMCSEGTGPSLNTNQSRPPSPHFPNCKKDFEIHSGINFASLSSYDGKGNLITRRYGPGSPISDFCIDYLVNTAEVVAVTCNLCKAKKVESQDHFLLIFLLPQLYLGSLCKHLLSSRVRLQGKHDTRRLLLRPRLWQ